MTPTAIFTEPTTLTWDSGSGSAHPFDGLTALNNVVEGYGPSSVCLYCTSNNAATNSPFQKSIDISQTEVDCSNLLTAKSVQPGPAVFVPYLYGGTELTFDYLSFFDETPITNCAVLSCNFGDTCGDATAISEPNINQVATTPQSLSYKQNVLIGYGPHSVCVQCKVTNDFIDQYTFSIEQLPLDCNNVLVANAQTFITHPYVEGGSGFNIVLTEFFTLTPIDGCTLVCNYGDTCGAAVALTHQTTVTPTTIFTEPTTLTWDSGSGTAHPFDTLIALNNVIEGYGPSTVCLYCTSNNAATNSPF